MGSFWDTYEDSGGLNFVGEEEKKVLIANAIELPVIRVLRIRDKFNPPDGEQFVVITELEGEERALGFKIGTVDSRDRMLSAMKAYLESEEEGAETPTFYIEKVGQSQILRDPNAES